MSRSPELARRVVTALKQELGDLVQATFGVTVPKGDAQAEDSLRRLKEDVLSGKGEAADMFIQSGADVGFGSDIRAKLQAAGVTTAQLEESGFMTGNLLSVSAILGANSQYQESSTARGV